ncbi:fatty acyl-coa reductase 1 [Phtheirospermum japonicum]|uniref:Fatty acyl-CoA reductase n=1 Tax=Phtheirospermum japonicum TaxID=374723 RepID=A0A830CTQ6_9LAMI|nr:fatty acyl-coa reductase 1 [Phtheirospermum japonicum]
MLLHVSTAYVHGTRTGLILEKPFHMDGSEIPNLDIDEEKKIIDEKLQELQFQKLTEKEITSAMKDLGIKRAIMHGWPNTYVFTKAMGEMMLGNITEEKAKNVVIIRPTIITSTYCEPFPGWAEGLRTLDSVFVAYGKDKLKFFVGDPESILDVIPGDMVVNCMIAAIAAHKNENRGKPIRVGKPTILNTMASFHNYIAIRCLPVLKVLQLLNIMFCNHFEHLYTKARHQVNHAMRLAELYKPYLFSKAIFDDFNTEHLRMTIKGGSKNVLNFDPKCIQWDEYFVNTHFPGIVKYVLK